MFRMELENIVANTVYIKARAGKSNDLIVFKFLLCEIIIWIKAKLVNIKEEAKNGNKCLSCLILANVSI